MRQPVMVTLAVLTAWYFSFLIVFVIPLDVSNTIYTNSNCSWRNESLSTTTTSSSTTANVSNISVTTTSTTSTTLSSTSTAESLLTRSRRSVNECSEPDSYIPSENIYSLWRIVYWSSQLLTWLVLPLMQSFTQAGEFSFMGKLKSSLWDNMIYYTSYAFIAIILIIYIALQPNLHLDWLKLKAIAASASNTWGLFLLVFMMGYGLVEVPRTLWYSSKRGYSLNQAYFKISKLWGERNDAEGSLEEVLVSVEGVRRKFATEGGSTLQHFIDIIVSKVPTEMLERVGRRVRAGEEGLVSEASLAKLHKQVMVAVTAHHRTEAQWSHMVDTVLWLEDNHKNSDNGDRVFRRQYGPGSVLSPQLEWYVRCMIVPRLLQMAAVTAAVLSVLLTWSEVTFFSDSPTLSIFAVLIQSAASSNHYRTIEVVSFLTIFYMSICTFYTVFKVSCNLTYVILDIACSCLGASSQLLLPCQQSPVRQLHSPLQWSSPVQNHPRPVSQLPFSHPHGQPHHRVHQLRDILYPGHGAHGRGEHRPGRLQHLLPHASDCPHSSNILLPGLPTTLLPWVPAVPRDGGDHGRVC